MLMQCSFRLLVANVQRNCSLVYCRNMQLSLCKARLIACCLKFIFNYLIKLLAIKHKSVLHNVLNYSFKYAGMPQQ